MLCVLIIAKSSRSLLPFFVVGMTIKRIPRYRHTDLNSRMHLNFVMRVNLHLVDGIRVVTLYIYIYEAQRIGKVETHKHIVQWEVLTRVTAEFGLKVRLYMR